MRNTQYAIRIAMKLIVGLGNPGPRYKNTRHNAGFLVVRRVAEETGIKITRKKYKGAFGEGIFQGLKVDLFMPETYMNLSGEAVREISRKKRIEYSDILVICDDINLKIGFIRLRKKGSSGGHNGLESIITCLGTSDFPRLRVGVGTHTRGEDLAHFVLNAFSRAEKATIQDSIAKAADCALLWISEGPDKAMLRFNKRQ